MEGKRTVLITGCSDGGLGSALALEFHAKGYRVFATVRNLSKLKDTNKVDIESIQLDVLSAESIRDCISAVEKLTGGSLDMLVLNAGASYSMPILDIKMEKLREHFELNVFSNIAVIQAFTPLLLKSAHGGLIAVNSSVASVLPLPFQASYNAGKAAVAMFAACLRMELEPLGLRVVELKTGGVKTNFFQSPPQLPVNSYYACAKDAVEDFMAGKTLKDVLVPKEAWAKEVAAELVKKSPKYEIWAGYSAGSAWIASKLPISMVDGALKKMTNLHVVQQKLTEQQDGKKKA